MLRSPNAIANEKPSSLFVPINTDLRLGSYEEGRVAQAWIGIVEGSNFPPSWIGLNPSPVVAASPALVSSSMGTALRRLIFSGPERSNGIPRLVRRLSNVV